MRSLLNVHVIKLFPFGDMQLLIYLMCPFISINLQKRRERGRINVRGIKLVEPAILHGEGGDASAPNVIAYFLY